MNCHTVELLSPFCCFDSHVKFIFYFEIEPFKCTGKFKEDFDSICQQKNLKYIPEVVSRSKRRCFIETREKTSSILISKKKSKGKRPGSAVQQLILNQIQQPDTTMAKNDKKTMAGNKGKATVVETEEIEQNPGILIKDLHSKKNVF